MQVIELIQKKRDNHRLSKQEINHIIKKYVTGSMPDYQMASLLMAICINGMSDQEISWLTDAMLYSGEVVSHVKNHASLIDKHSTGGIGDKISIPLAPAAAACGIRVPMIAGRGLGHTGGTLDKLESIPGFRCSLSSVQYRHQVSDIGCVIMGQTDDIAPADKKLYALRDVTGTVESIPLIASSIMSKKLAEGIDGLVLDVKFGSGAFMTDIEAARTLATTMVAIGSHMGKSVTARLTNMDQPLGRMIGNSLEIFESIEILNGQGPIDTVMLTTELGAEMLVLGKCAMDLADGRAKIKESLTSGAALKKFVQMVRAQGGDESIIYEPERLSIAKRKIVIRAEKDGFVDSMNSRAIGLAVGALGGGRCQLTDVIDHSVGVEIHAKVGDRVIKGQPLCTIFANRKGIDEAKQKIKNSIAIVDHGVAKPLLCVDRITTHEIFL